MSPLYGEPRGPIYQVVCSSGGKRAYLWRAVDDEGEVLDVTAQKRGKHDAPMTLHKRLLRDRTVEPLAIVTDGVASYGSALRERKLRHLPQSG